MLLILAFGYSFSCLYATIGLVTMDPGTAQMAGFLPLLLLIFASSAFVPVATMPSWLRGFASDQPVSVAVNAARALLNGLPAWHYIWQTVMLIVNILAVFVPMSVRAYRRLQEGDPPFARHCKTIAAITLSGPQQGRESSPKSGEA